MKKRIALITFIFGIILIGIGFILNNKENNNNIDNPPIEEKNSYTGIYQLDNTIIKIYQYDDNKLYYWITTESSNTSNIGIIEKDHATGHNFENTYTFSLVDKNLKMDINGTSTEIYQRISDYSKEYFYSDKYGEAIYINSKYNGDYSFDDNKIYVYQKNNSEVRIYMVFGSDSIDLNYEIKEDGSLYAEILNDKVTVTFNGNNMIYDSISVNSPAYKYKGTYTKVKTLTIDDIINNIE